MPEESEGFLQRLFEAISAFIQADSWEEADQIAKQYPELLSDKADVLLSQFVEDAQRHGDEESTETLAKVRTLLRRCREAGVQQAFPELRRESLDGRTGELQAMLDGLLPDMRSLMVDLIARPSSPQELSAAIKQHPELTAALARVLQSPSLHPGISGLNRLLEDLARLEDYESRTDLSVEELLQEKELVGSILSRISRTDMSVPWAKLQEMAGNICTRLYGAIGQREYAEEAVTAYREALTDFQPPSPDWARTQSNLGIIFCRLFEATGHRDHAEQAVASFRQALTVRRPPSPDWAITQNNLGNMFFRLFESTGQRECGDEAVAAYRQALTVWRAPSTQWAGAQNNLGNIFSCLFDTTGQREHAEESVAAYRQSLTVLQPPSAQWAMTQNNLGNIYTGLFEATKKRDYAEQAATAYRQALTVRRPPSPDWATTQNNLGNICTLAFESAGQREHADEAASALRQALTVHRPETFPVQCRLSSRILGRLLLVR